MRSWTSSTPELLGNRQRMSYGSRLKPHPSSGESTCGSLPHTFYLFNPQCYIFQLCLTTWISQLLIPDVTSIMYLLLPCRHYPVGVLYDLYGRSVNLPWEITVHFRVSLYTAHFCLTWERVVFAVQFLIPNISSNDNTYILHLCTLFSNET